MKYNIEKNIPAVMLILAVLFINAFSVSVSAEDGDFPVLEKHVEIRQAHLRWTMAIVEISMGATIEYINEISEGSGTSGLSMILDDFRNQNEKTETLTTHVALNNANRQLREIIQDFRLETGKQMKEYGGKGLQLISRVRGAIDENEDDLNSMKETYWEIREKNSLEIFDIWVNRAQCVLDLLNNRGYDTFEAQDKLDELSDMRGDLKNAFDDRDNSEIHQLHLEIRDLSKELTGIVRDLQIKIPQETIVKHWINVGDRAVERTATIISELELLGVDVMELKAIQSKTETDVKRARDEFDAGNIKGATDALKDLKTDLIELRDAYDELLFEGMLPEEAESAVEKMSDMLDNTASNMEKSI